MMSMTMLNHGYYMHDALSTNRQGMLCVRPVQAKRHPAHRSSV